MFRLVDSLVDIETRDLSGCIFLEFRISELYPLYRLVRRVFSIQILDLILEILLKVGYALVFQKFCIREYLGNNCNLILLYAAFSCIYNNFNNAFNLLKISLDFLRINIFSII